MAITQAIATVFKQDLMSPGGNLAAQSLKCALYTNAATLNATTTVYNPGNEVTSSGSNYTAGGNTLTNVAISVDGTTAILMRTMLHFQMQQFLLKQHYYIMRTMQILQLQF